MSAAPFKSASLTTTDGWTTILMPDLDELYVTVDTAANNAAELRWIDDAGRPQMDTVALPIGTHSWTDWADKGYGGFQLRSATAGAPAGVSWQAYGS